MSQSRFLGSRFNVPRLQKRIAHNTVTYSWTFLHSFSCLRAHDSLYNLIWNKLTPSTPFFKLFNLRAESLNKLHRSIASVGFKYSLHFIFSNAECLFQFPAVFSFNSIHKYSEYVFRKFMHQSQINSADVTLKFSHRIYIKSREDGFI